MELLQRVSEGLARKTSRRGLFGRGAEIATGALLGAAAGGVVGAEVVGATDQPTHCSFPGPPCTCGNCSTGGVCQKPCYISSNWYPSGCWVVSPPGKGTITCCDCSCPDMPPPNHWCGCGSDYHNNPAYCP